jgi:hypothetical protein
VSGQDCVAEFVARAERDAREDGSSSVSEGDLVAVMTAAVRLYARRAEDAEGALAPPIDAGALSTTEVLTAACEMIRAVNVNMFDVQLWFSRGQN